MKFPASGASEGTANSIWDESGMAEEGFHQIGSQGFSVDVRLSPEQIVGYLTTRSALIAVVEDDPVLLQSARDDLLKELVERLGSAERILPFGGEILYYAVPET